MLTQSIIVTKFTVIHALYKNIFKRIFFLFDPERVHDRIIRMGKACGRSNIMRSGASALFTYSHEILKQNICGITFSNPVGLAAGFDKNAELTDIMPAIGFGFMEAGSVTGKPCEGNAKPRLWRLPQSQSLVVHYGLMNDGCEVVASRLLGKQCAIPLGISIAKTNTPDTVACTAGVDDYLKAYKTFYDAKIGDYYTINISCPNTYGGEPFTDPVKLELLLSALAALPKIRPLFVKFSPDLDTGQVDALIAVIVKFNIDGVIVSNLTKNRNNVAIKEKDVPVHGGISGKVVELLANNLIAYIYRKTHGTLVIIGCGGVCSAGDAYKKIRLGASLIQLITGMIYEGPQLIGHINQGLVRLLKKDGFTALSQAVGRDVHI